MASGASASAGADADADAKPDQDIPDSVQLPASIHQPSPRTDRHAFIPKPKAKAPRPSGNPGASQFNACHYHNKIGSVSRPHSVRTCIISVRLIGIPLPGPHTG